MEHMILHCASNTHSIPGQIQNLENPMEWMMSRDRLNEEQIQISLLVLCRWDTRCDTLEYYTQTEPTDESEVEEAVETENMDTFIIENN